MAHSAAPIEMAYTKEKKVRLILFLITAVAFCLLEFTKIKSYCDEAGYCFSVIEYSYLITACGANLPYTSIAFLLLLENSYQSSLRFSAKKTTEQIFKSFRAGLFAALCIVFFSLIPALFAGTWNTMWTEPSLISAGQLTDSIIPRMVYTDLSPLGGLFISFIVLMVFWSSVGCLLFTCKKAGLYHLGVALFLYMLFWNSIHFPDSSSFIPNWFFSLNSIINYSGAQHLLAELWKVFALNMGIIIFSVICNAAREHYCHIITKER